MIAFGVRANSNLSIFSCVCQQQHEFNASAAPCIREQKKNPLWQNATADSYMRNTHKIHRGERQKNIHAQWLNAMMHSTGESQVHAIFIFFRISSFFQFIRKQNRNCISFRKKITFNTSYKMRPKHKRSIENEITRGQRPMILFVLYTEFMFRCLSFAHLYFQQRKRIQMVVFFINPRSTTKT